MATIDERYKRGKIYTIRNITDDTMIYVGSTIDTLPKRLGKHRRDCKGGKSINLYKHIIENDWSDWYIEWYEDFPCNSKQELNRREGEVIREIGTINKNIAGRTRKEYREETVDKEKEKVRLKKYFEENRDKEKVRLKKYFEENRDKINRRRREMRKIKTEKG